MEQSRKNLKISAFLVLLFALLDFVSVVVQICYFNFSQVPIPEGAPSNIVMITKIVLFVISVLILAPQVFVGIRGLQFANKPKAKKCHIVWAKVLFVVLIVVLVSQVASIINQANGNTISAALTTLVEVIIYFDYIRYATEVYNEA